MPSLCDNDDDRWSVLLIASSAGGLQGLKTLLGGLRAELPVPVLVAQHLNRDGGTRIVPILARYTALTVKLAEEGEAPRAGTVYIAPPDQHLCIGADGMLFLTREDRINFARPAADPLFEAAADAYGKGIIACVLTGSDSDGARGVEAVKGHGGTVIVQDPETAEFHGMPRAAVRTGKVDYILPLAAIAPAITRLIHADGHALGPFPPS